MVSLSSFREQSFAANLSGFIPAPIRDYRASIAFYVCALTVVCALLLGGGTRGGFLSDALLELIAVPAFLISLWSLIDSPVWRNGTRPDLYWVLALCMAITLVPLLQLIPLPPSIWVNPLHREELAKVYDLLGSQVPWMPISVSPRATWLSFLSLLPPTAIFIAAIQLNYRERRELSLVIIAIGVVSVFLGMTQVADGPASLLRFFTVTNDTEAVGFFANRNHFAALLYAVLLFVAVWAIDCGFKIKSWTDITNFEAKTAITLLAFLMMFMVIIAGEAMARSRAGLALTIAALLAVFALTFMDPRNVAGAKTGKIILGTTILAVVLSMQFAVYRILDRFATDPIENARIVFARNTATAAKAFMPVGSGSGTFVPVYQLFERPNDTIPNTFANHAHNDVLELWLETGVLGPLLLCLFMIWFAVTALKLWRRPSANVTPFDCTLARAATVIIVLLLAHSFVDYPMRTDAIMAVFAACCALMIEPVRDEGVRFAASVERYPTQRKPAPQAQMSRGAAFGSVAPANPAREPVARQQAGQLWGAEIDWPKEWRSSGGDDKGSDPKPDADGTSQPDNGRSPPR
jgi:O-antigen ligase